MNFCAYCTEQARQFPDEELLDSILATICVCGIRFGSHGSKHPHPKDGCQAFEAKVIYHYGPRLPTAEEIYESLRDS